MILRRYTPPTCTLEIKNQGILLPWQKSPKGQKIRFNLRFDDPRLVTTEYVAIQGDQTRLDLLIDVVGDYIQDLLKESPIPSKKEEKLGQNYLNQKEDQPAKIDQLIPATEAIKENKNRPPLSTNQLTSSLAERARQTIDADRNTINQEENLAKNVADSEIKINPLTSLPRFSEELYIIKKDWFSHELFLGLLATEETGKSIHLSLTQLCDLWTALQEYSADVASGWKANQGQIKTNPIPEWAYTVAILLVTIGVTTVLFKTLESTGNNQASAPTPTPKSTVIPTITPTPISIPSPVVLLPKPSPGLTPKPTTSPGLPLVVPSPPAMPPAPPPNIPQAVNIPVAVAPRPQNVAPVPPRPQPILPPVNEAPDPPVMMESSSAPAPQQPYIPLPPVPPPPPPLIPPNAYIPRVSTDITQKDLNPYNGSLSGDQASVPRGNPVIEIPIPTKLKLPEIPDSKSDIPDGEKIATTVDNNSSANGADQVANVKSYFQERWQPPAGLEQPLQYSLELDGDGVVKKIVSIGQSSEDYLKDAPMPTIGDSLGEVSSQSKDAKIRVVLMPDGKVQAFSEAIN